MVMILIPILHHQPHFHTPNLWRTVVLHLCLCMEGWSMSVQVWVLALSTKMCLHTHTTGTVLSVARPLNEPQHATLWVPWLCKVYCIYPPIVLLHVVCYTVHIHFRCLLVTFNPFWKYTFYRLKIVQKKLFFVCNYQLQFSTAKLREKFLLMFECNWTCNYHC